MRTVAILIAAAIIMLFVNKAFAIQEIKDVSIVEVSMNHDEKICTIIIDQNIPPSDSTGECTQRNFSWKCFNDDYLWHMVLHIKKNNLPIDIRYSSDECFNGKSGNFKLLTVW